MRTIIILSILLFSENLLASACFKTKWSEEPSEFIVTEICETDNCDNYSKWDLLYFSAKIFGYTDLQDFHDIKVPDYQAKHCMIRVTGERSGTHLSRSKGLQNVTQEINEIVLTNIACPNIGDSIKGHIIFQQKFDYEISTCRRTYYTGRVFLNVSTNS